MNRSVAVILSCVALVGIVLAAAPASAEAMEAEQLLELYHSRGLPPTVAPPVKKVLQQVVAALENGDEPKALAIWKKLWQRYPTEFSAVERARMLRWVLYRVYLAKGKPLRAVVAAWEQEHKSPSAQKLAIPDLQAAMDEQTELVQAASSIMKNMHDTAKAVIRKLK